MPIDADLLREARTAEGRVIDAEHDAEVARADFHQAVRRLQLAGASLREIADALGLSHQRVHQIVTAAGGGRPWRDRRAAKGLHSCSFCGNQASKVRALVSGPGVFICDTCVPRADQVLATGVAAATDLATIAPVSEADRVQRCSFCGKRRHEVPAMAAAGEVWICSPCLELCREVIDQQRRRWPG
jgi:ribosomal protein L37AE/L43A